MSVSLSDIEAVRFQLIFAAQRGRPLTYSDLLFELGHDFSRPKMRSVCKTLDAIDTAAVARGEPELAVLVVRQSDGLPGQGWWMGVRGMTRAPDGSRSGTKAAALVRTLQENAFRYWSARPPVRPQDPER